MDNSKRFYIQMSELYFRKGDKLATGSIEKGGDRFVVIKIYELTWWKKILIKFGFKFRVNQIKVEKI